MNLSIFIFLALFMSYTMTLSSSIRVLTTSYSLRQCAAVSRSIPFFAFIFCVLSEKLFKIKGGQSKSHGRPPSAIMEEERREIKTVNIIALSSYESMISLRSGEVVESLTNIGGGDFWCCHVGREGFCRLDSLGRGRH